MPHRNLGFLLAALAALSGCSPKAPAQSAGIDLAGMDKSVAPGDDFNAYANGGWIKSTPIPADKSGYGIDAILADETRKRTRSLIEDVSKASNAPSADARKVGDFYSTYMDEAAIESKGIAPLKPQLDSFAAIADRRALAHAIGSRLRADVDALNNTNFETPNLFGLWFTQGLEDPSHTYPYLLQGGLGMPDRDYYLSASPHMAELRKQYLAHIEAMFKLAGFTDPAARAARVFALETAIAKVHATRVESEDVHSAIKWNRADFPAKAPGLDWSAVFDAAGLNDASAFIVWHPKAVTGLSALAAKEPLDAWKDWLALHAVEDAASCLPKAFVDERFNFYGKALSGVPEQRPRWQRAIDFTNGALGDAVGKMYADRYFRPEWRSE
jgi:predicted metalloendopeptidase